MQSCNSSPEEGQGMEGEDTGRAKKIQIRNKNNLHQKPSAEENESPTEAAR